MVVAYWIVAAVLAIAYLAAGGMKLARPKDRLVAAGMGFAEDFAPAPVKLIGLAEVLGALGLILPPLTRIAPWLAIVAAIGLVVVQLGAIVVHIRRGEQRMLGVNVGLLVLAAVAVWLGTAVV